MNKKALSISALALSSLLIVSACGNKENKGGGDGGGGGQSFPPHTYQYSSSDGFDNSYGINPLRSIKGQSIRNMSFHLRDSSGTNMNTIIQIQLAFDGQGLLNAAATIDNASFDPMMANQMSSDDPFNMYRNNQVPANNSQIVTYRGSNIPYFFDRSTGEIKINNFILGSNVMGSTGTPASGRLAIAIQGASVHRKQYGKVIRLTTSSVKMKKSIQGHIARLDGFHSDDEDLSVKANPSEVGFEISTDLAVAPGALTAVPFNRIETINGQVQYIQTTRDEFMTLPGKSPVFYQEPVLDPRTNSGI